MLFLCVPETQPSPPEGKALGAARGKEAAILFTVRGVSHFTGNEVGEWAVGPPALLRS